MEKVCGVMEESLQECFQDYRVCWGDKQNFVITLDVNGDFLGKVPFAMHSVYYTQDYNDYYYSMNNFVVVFVILRHLPYSAGWLFLL